MLSPVVLTVARVLAEHDVRLTRRGWTARCDCGWHGEERVHAGEALRDGDLHVAEIIVGVLTAAAA